VRTAYPPDPWVIKRRRKTWLLYEQLLWPAEGKVQRWTARRTSFRVRGSRPKTKIRFALYNGRRMGWVAASAIRRLFDGRGGSANLLVPRWLFLRALEESG
jgi:hypothetical protein